MFNGMFLLDNHTFFSTPFNGEEKDIFFFFLCYIF